MFLCLRMILPGMCEPHHIKKRHLKQLRLASVTLFVLNEPVISAHCFSPFCLYFPHSLSLEIQVFLRLYNMSNSHLDLSRHRLTNTALCHKQQYVYFDRACITINIL